MNRNVEPDLCLTIVMIKFNLDLRLISSLFFQINLVQMATMSLQVEAAEDMRPRRVGTFTHTRRGYPFF